MRYTLILLIGIPVLVWLYFEVAKYIKENIK